MREPYRKRQVNTPPLFNTFKPEGVPKRMLKRVELTLDEYEAIRLADYVGLDHLEASEKMNISRPTFTRLIEKARNKLAQSIIEGKELVIDGGNINFINTLHRCFECGEITPLPFSAENKNCPDCGSTNVENLALNYIRHRHGRRGRWK